MSSEIQIYSRRELDALGMSDRAIRRAVAEKRAIAIRPGRFVKASEWNDLYVEARQRVRAAAAADACAVAPIHCLVTAAALHGLPLFRIRDERVHVLSRADRAAAKNRLVMRHEDAFSDDDLEEQNGFLLTTVDRTVFDLIRLLKPEAGVALADAALRAASDAEALRAAIEDRIGRASGARGIRRARAVLAFADHRAESPGESVSRWYLHVLGFEGIRIQVSFAGPDGTEFRIDIKFRYGWGEFDGAAKYADPDFLRGRTPQEAFLDEKRREDWVRGRSQEPFARWMDKDMPDARTLGAHLAAFGITPWS
jgi:hypothetical protein